MTRTLERTDFNVFGNGESYRIEVQNPPDTNPEQTYASIKRNTPLLLEMYLALEFAQKELLSRNEENALVVADSVLLSDLVYTFDGEVDINPTVYSNLLVAENITPQRLEAAKFIYEIWEYLEDEINFFRDSVGDLLVIHRPPFEAKTIKAQRKAGRPDVFKGPGRAEKNKKPRIGNYHL